MARRGQRKYRCDECGEESWHHWIERNRAARMRCPRCGSTHLELVVSEAIKDAAEKNAVRIEGGTASTTLPHEKANRKVT
jgi:DNA-directed RNA polymerase subunit RPC12/RpoP